MRVNPDFSVKGSGMRMGGGPQQFGVDVEQTPALLRPARGPRRDVHGFHVFAGSQNLQRRHPRRGAPPDRSSSCSGSQTSVSEPLTYLNLGGGFGIPYTDADVPLDLAQVAGDPA